MKTPNEILYESLKVANQMCKWDTETMGYRSMKDGINKAIALAREDMIPRDEVIKIIDSQVKRYRIYPLPLIQDIKNEIAQKSQEEKS